MNRRTDLVNIGHASADRLHGQYCAYQAETFPNASARKG